MAGGGRATIYSGTNWVLVYAGGGGDRLEIGESVTFSVQAQATQPGAYDFINHTHRRQDCTGAQVDGLPWAMVVAPVIIATPVADAGPDAGSHARAHPQANSGSHARSHHGTGGDATHRSHAHRAPDTHGVAQRAPAAPRLEPAPWCIPAAAGSATHRFRARLRWLCSRPCRTAGGGTSSVGVGTEVFALLNGPLVWFVPGAVVGVPGPVGHAVDRAPGPGHLGLDPGRAPDER